MTSSGAPPPSETATGSVRRLADALRLVRASAPRETLLSALLLPVLGLVAPLQLVVLKYVVDSLARLVAGGPRALHDSLAWVAAAGGLTVLSVLLQAASRLVTEQLSLKVNDRVQGRIHQQAISLDLAYFETPDYHDHLHRAQREGGSRPARILTLVVGLGRDAFSLVAVGLLLLWTAPWAALLAGAAALPTLWSRTRSSGALYLWRRRRTQTERLAAVLDAVLSTASFAKEIRIFGLGPHLAARHTELRQELQREQLELGIERARTQVLAQTAGALAVFGALSLVVLRVSHGALGLGAAVMCFGALQRCFGLAQQLMNGLADLHEDALFLTHL
jgi:ATP-binding cassette, subfamily B, bacterial